MADFGEFFVFICETLKTRRTLPCCYGNKQNRLRFVYTHFKSCDQPLDKTSFELSNIFRAMQNCAMIAKSSIIPKLPIGMVI